MKAINIKILTLAKLQQGIQMSHFPTLGSILTTSFEIQALLVIIQSQFFEIGKFLQTSILKYNRVSYQMHMLPENYRDFCRLLTEYLHEYISHSQYKNAKSPPSESEDLEPRRLQIPVKASQKEYVSESQAGLERRERGTRCSNKTEMSRGGSFFKKQEVS